jgi:cation diffusion facilitator family transporter
MERIREIKRVLVITFFLNLVVSGTKIVLGYITNSVAILSDGVHSFYDGISNVIGYIGVSLSASPPDERHPYGHRKYETLFTIGLSLLLLITCLEIFKRAFRALMEDARPEVTSLSFLIMLITLGANIFVNRYELKKGRALNSEYLLADAGHTGSDILVTIGVLISLYLSRLGIPRVDAIAGLVVGILVARIGYIILKSAVDILRSVFYTSKSFKSFYSNRQKAVPILMVTAKGTCWKITVEPKGLQFYPCPLFQITCEKTKVNTFQS